MTGRIAYDTAYVGAICERLAEGQSLVAICKRDDMPAYSTIMDWLSKHPEFAERYARAREAQADYLADEIVQIADDAEDAQKARLQVDARKWKASKLAPKKYGERVEQTLLGPGGGPLQSCLEVVFRKPAVEQVGSG